MEIGIKESKDSKQNPSKAYKGRNSTEVVVLQLSKQSIEPLQKHSQIIWDWIRKDPMACFVLTTGSLSVLPLGLFSLYIALIIFSTFGLGMFFILLLQASLIGVGLMIYAGFQMGILFVAGSLTMGQVVLGQSLSRLIKRN